MNRRSFLASLFAAAKPKDNPTYQDRISTLCQCMLKASTTIGLDNYVSGSVLLRPSFGPPHNEFYIPKPDSL